MGIDVGKKMLGVTMLSGDEILKQAKIPYERAAIESFLSRFPGCRIKAVYEAGCFGYWLYDTLTELGVETIVTPPSKVPHAPGERVKTDRRDSRKLAVQHQAKTLSCVPIPAPQERARRQLVRTHRQLVRTRVRTMVQIRSLLEFHHLLPPPQIGNAWSPALVAWLETTDLKGTPDGEFLRRSLDAMLRIYHEVSEEVNALKKEIAAMAKSRRYAQAATVLRSTPGIGPLAAMTILTEINRIDRFPTSQQFTAYLGLIPSEHSTSETQRQGHITKTGNAHLRGILVESSWIWIRKDQAAYTTYRRIARRREPKRAIVAMARRLATKVYWQLRTLKYGA
jgi:transposase